MTTNMKLLIGGGAVAVVAAGVAIGLLMSRPSQETDLSTIHTQAAQETMASSQDAAAESPAVSETEEAQTNAPAGVSASIETYTSGNISIQYPAVSQLSDSSMEERVNELLKNNALSVIEANGIDESSDTLTIKCQVISIDRRRLTATYSGDLTVQGAAHPVNMFYTNTVDLTQAQDISFEDLADAYTMAGYVLSDDVKFLGLTPDLLEAVLEYRSSMTVDDLTRIFSQADFPLDDGMWPESFSYEQQGAICFSLPVPHALGDYVIVSYDPVTK